MLDALRREAIGAWAQVTATDSACEGIGCASSRIVIHLHLFDAHMKNTAPMESFTWSTRNKALCSSQPCAAAGLLLLFNNVYDISKACRGVVSEPEEQLFCRS